MYSHKYFHIAAIVVAVLLTGSILTARLTDLPNSRWAVKPENIESYFTEMHVPYKSWGRCSYSAYRKDIGKIYVWYVGNEVDYDIDFTDKQGDVDRLGALCVSFFDAEWQAESVAANMSIGGVEDYYNERYFILKRRRIYLYQNAVVYYSGGDEEIYSLLENLCGKPIAGETDL